MVTLYFCLGQILLFMLRARTKILLFAAVILTVNIVLFSVLVLAPAPEEVSVHKVAPVNAEQDVGGDTLAPTGEIDVRADAAEVVVPAAAEQRTEYVIPVVATGTVLAAMEALAHTSSGFSYAGENYPGLGFFLNEINGVASSRDHYWILIINEEKAARGASTAEVTPADTVLWRYEKAYEY